MVFFRKILKCVFFRKYVLLFDSMSENLILQQNGESVFFKNGCRENQLFSELSQHCSQFFIVYSRDRNNISTFGSQSHLGGHEYRLKNNVQIHFGKKA